VNTHVIGRTIQAFLDLSGLREGKDYTKVVGGGHSARYHINIKKEKIKKLRENLKISN